MTRMLAPLEGSNLSTAAVPLAAWLSRGLKCEVILLTVDETPQTREHAVEERAELTHLLQGERPGRNRATAVLPSATSRPLLRLRAIRPIDWR
jgi:hypothetical protein